MPYAKYQLYDSAGNETEIIGQCFVAMATMKDADKQFFAPLKVGKLVAMRYRPRIGDEKDKIIPQLFRDWYEYWFNHPYFSMFVDTNDVDQFYQNGIGIDLSIDKDLLMVFLKAMRFGEERLYKLRAYEFFRTYVPDLPKDAAMYLAIVCEDFSTPPSKMVRFKGRDDKDYVGHNMFGYHNNRFEALRMWTDMSLFSERMVNGDSYKDVLSYEGTGEFFARYKLGKGKRIFKRGDSYLNYTQAIKLGEKVCRDLQRLHIEPRS